MTDYWKSQIGQMKRDKFNDAALNVQMDDKGRGTQTSSSAFGLLLEVPDLSGEFPDKQRTEKKGKRNSDDISSDGAAIAVVRAIAIRADSRLQSRTVNSTDGTFLFLLPGLIFHKICGLRRLTA